MAFVYIEFHLPLLTPFLHSIQVFLQFFSLLPFLFFLLTLHHLQKGSYNIIAYELSLIYIVNFIGASTVGVPLCICVLTELYFHCVLPPNIKSSYFSVKL